MFFIGLVKNYVLDERKNYDFQEVFLYLKFRGTCAVLDWIAGMECEGTVVLWKGLKGRIPLFRSGVLAKHA